MEEVEEEEHNWQMKIAYLGYFERHFETENWLAFALEQNGHEVIKFQIRDEDPDVEAVIATDPDFVLISKIRSKRTLYALDIAGILTVAWMNDMQFYLPPDRSGAGLKKVDGVLSEPAFHADIVFSADSHDAEWEKLGITHRTSRQAIHEPYCSWEEPKAGIKDVVFLGTAYYEGRQRMLEFLKENYSFMWYGIGKGAMAPFVPYEELNATVRGAKIVVGDSMPNYGWWSERLYETLGRGGVFAHPLGNGIEDDGFIPGKHFIGFEYGNFADMKEKLDWYLSHDEEREAMALAGYELVKNKHTYRHRMEAMMSDITEIAWQKLAK